MNKGWAKSDYERILSLNDLQLISEQLVLSREDIETLHTITHTSDNPHETMRNHHLLLAMSLGCGDIALGVGGLVSNHTVFIVNEGDYKEVTNTGHKDYIEINKKLVNSFSCIFESNQITHIDIERILSIYSGGVFTTVFEPLFVKGTKTISFKMTSREGFILINEIREVYHGW